MCGIATLVSRRPDAPLAPDVRRMCDAIRHRGPDDAGYVAQPHAALGMRRLSIIDVAGGHQPIANEDDRRWIVFNGEIYNHRALRARLEAAGHVFRTRSDTEVILHGHEEWGDDVVRHLHGMFAFAIWDATRARLFAARDPLGIKPLYLWETADGVALCSELRGFLALPHFPRDVDDASLVDYLALGYVPQPGSIFRAATKLPPGTRLSWTPADGLRQEPYWHPADIAPADLGEAAAVARLRELLHEAVASHLESEVPLGAFLSGGLDSSAVVALMARAAPGRVRTFSIGFEGASDESVHASRIAAAIGTEHEALVLRPDAHTLLDATAGIYDEPFADPSALPTYLVSALARRTVTVALSGDGGDELFAGYPWHVALAGRSADGPRLGGLAAILRRRWPAGLPGLGRVLDRLTSRRESFNARHLLPLLEREGGPLRDDAARVPQVADWFGETWERAAARDFVAQMGAVDVRHYLADDILAKVDRASMAVSLEARPPFLHLPLVEFALSLPAHLRTRHGVGKYLFRRAIEGLVPAAVLDYPKRGFDPPMDAWLAGELRELTRGLPALAERFPHLLSARAIGRMAARHGVEGRRHGRALWRLAVLRRWLDALDAGTLARPLERLDPAALLTGRRAAPTVSLPA